MTLTLEKTQTEQIDIPVPCFFRSMDERNYVGLLDEKTVVTIYNSDGFIMIKNTSPEFAKSDIKEAYTKFTACTETEFMEKYDQVVESISLHPKLAV